jgi:hypothetical protein
MFYLLAVDLAFFRLQVVACNGEGILNYSNILLMFLKIIHINQHIVSVGSTEIVQIRCQYVLEIILEHCWGICEAKGHN